MRRKMVASVFGCGRQLASSRWLASRLPVMAGLSLTVLVAACEQDDQPTTPPSPSSAERAQGPLSPRLVEQGREIFRFDAFGDETFWSDTLRMHEVIRGTVGPGVSPGARPGVTSA